MDVRYRVGKGMFENYRIGEDGTIWSRKRGKWKLLKPGRCGKNGQLRVNINNRGKTIMYAVGRLVLEAWKGKAPKEGMICGFKDGDRENTAANNLEWRSISENALERNQTKIVNKLREKE